MAPRSATASTASAFGMPLLINVVPSIGSTATSTSGPSPFPTSSPLKSIGASSFSPSPITTTPRIRTVSSTTRIASTAAASADSFSPRPIQRAAPIAPASVTRTSSSAMFRSGTRLLTRGDPTLLHAVRRRDPDQVERACDHGLRGAAEREAERLLIALEDSVLVVEAVKVVGDADRVLRDRLGAALLHRVGDDGGQ